MRGYLDTLKVIVQIALRNLFASRLKTLIVGGIHLVRLAPGGGGNRAGGQRGRLHEPQA